MSDMPADGVPVLFRGVPREKGSGEREANVQSFSFDELRIIERICFDCLHERLPEVGEQSGH
jgi:hypothetical protein